MASLPSRPGARRLFSPLTFSNALSYAYLVRLSKLQASPRPRTHLARLYASGQGTRVPLPFGNGVPLFRLCRCAAATQIAFRTRRQHRAVNGRLYQLTAAVPVHLSLSWFLARTQNR